jgi:hypothetical protein
MKLRYFCHNFVFSFFLLFYAAAILSVSFTFTQSTVYWNEATLLLFYNILTRVFVVLNRKNYRGLSRVNLILIIKYKHGFFFCCRFLFDTIILQIDIISFNLPVSLYDEMNNKTWTLCWETNIIFKRLRFLYNFHFSKKVPWISLLNNMK